MCNRQESEDFAKEIETQINAAFRKIEEAFVKVEVYLKDHEDRLRKLESKSGKTK